MAETQRLVVGISSASGVIYGVRLLEMLQGLPVETHLVMTRAAEVTVAHETTLKVAQVQALANRCHPIADIAASISSGSFKTMGMIVAPCSIRSMSEIASGVTSSLLTRAADVTLKEKRRLVLMVREIAVPSRAFAHHGAAGRDGRGHRPAGAGLLLAPADARGHDRPQPRADARPLRPGDRKLRRWGEDTPDAPRRLRRNEPG